MPSLSTLTYLGAFFGAIVGFVGVVLAVRAFLKWARGIGVEFVNVTVKPLVKDLTEATKGLKNAVETLSVDMASNTTAVDNMTKFAEAQLVANADSATDRASLHTEVDNLRATVNELQATLQMRRQTDHPGGG